MKSFDELLTKKHAAEGTLRYPCGCRLEARPAINMVFCASHRAAWQRVSAKADELERASCR